MPLHEDFKSYLGFKIVDDEGRVRYFEYVMMPFGFVDAARVVTKLLKAPLMKWRGWGARVAEAHIDEVIVISEGREKVLELSRRVHEDLLRFGLLISEDKCTWGRGRGFSGSGSSGTRGSSSSSCRRRRRRRC